MEPAPICISEKSQQSWLCDYGSGLDSDAKAVIALPAWIPERVSTSGAIVRTFATHTRGCPNVRTNRRLSLRADSLPTHRRARGVENLLVPRLSADCGERNGQRALSHPGVRDHRIAQRVRSGGRERQPCSSSLLPEVRVPCVRRFARVPRSRGRSRRNVGRSFFDQAGREHLEFQRPRMGLP
jgi:hypothetical protein